MIRLSPGILVSSHQLLSRMYRYKNFDILSQLTKNHSIDGTKTIDVLDTIRACKWIEVVEDSARLSPMGNRIAQGFDVRIKRLMIGDYIKYASDSWISLIPRGRKECSPYLPSDVLTCIKNAGLLTTPVTDEIVLWWDQQSQTVRNEQVLSNLNTGRIGEKLTIAFERDRTSVDPVWKSVESNFAGYDILSIVNKLDTARLSIEVKTSEKPMVSASAFITRHEWDVACDSVQYLFYFWHLSGTQKMLAIVTPEELQGHLPVDKGEGKWQNAEVLFRIFEKNFVEQK